jgi:DNA-binding Lrp family transcriptional regulator
VEYRTNQDRAKRLIPVPIGVSLSKAIDHAKIICSVQSWSDLPRPPTNRDLARSVGVAPSTCLERVRLLRARGVITGYDAEISMIALNRTVQALLHVQLRPLSRAVIEGFKACVIALPRCWRSSWWPVGRLPGTRRRAQRRQLARLPVGQPAPGERPLPQLSDLPTCPQPHRRTPGSMTRPKPGGSQNEHVVEHHRPQVRASATG